MRAGEEDGEGIESTGAEGFASSGEASYRRDQLMRWNFGSLIVDVTFFSIASSFFDLGVVLPLLMERLGASGPLIGAFAALRFLMFSGFQIFVAYKLIGKPRQKPYLLLIMLVTRTPLLVLPLFVLHSADSSGARQFALLMVILLYTFWAFGDGLGYVAWMEIVARAFTERVRSRFFATTQLISGVVTVAVAASVVRLVLESARFPYPANYAILLICSAVMFQLSTFGISLIKEPPPPDIEHEPLPPLLDYVRRLPKLVAENPIFIKLAVIQLLLGFGGAAAPFYVLYATSRFHLSDTWGGLYQMCSALGVVVMMPLWALLNEKLGPAATVRGVAFACLLTPFFALTVGNLHPWLFGLVFLMMGGSLGWGMWIALNHFLLTHISEHERPIFVALLNLLFAPSAIFPFLGGLLVQHHHFAQVAGIPVLFMMTFIVVSVGCVFAMRLPAPTERP